MYRISAPVKQIEWKLFFPCRRIAENLPLLAMLLRNDLRSKFRHSVLGFFWLFIPPVTILLIYVYMFSIVFKMRWPDSNFSSRWGFGLLIYSGITVYSAFSDTVMGSLNLLTTRAGMLKRFPFPFELLSVSMACANFLVSAVVLWILFFISLATGGNGSFQALFYFPLIYLPYALLLIGCSWIISALGVFFRDLSNLLGILLLVLFFVSPILYSAKMVPPQFLWALRLNPLTPVISNIHCAFLQNESPDLTGILCSWGIGLLVFHLGFCFFWRMRRRFADVV